MQVIIKSVGKRADKEKQTELSGKSNSINITELKQKWLWLSEQGKHGLVRVTRVVVEPGSCQDHVGWQSVGADLRELAQSTLPPDLRFWPTEMPFCHTLDQTNFADVCFMVGDHPFYCHKVYTSACSVKMSPSMDSSSDDIPVYCPATKQRAKSTDRHTLLHLTTHMTSCFLSFTSGAAFMTSQILHCREYSRVCHVSEKWFSCLFTFLGDCDAPRQNFQVALITKSSSVVYQWTKLSEEFLREH
ncbi:hypothetical protein E2C01_019577 [Portunus trituberculatus]|uniref:BTB domain-containing protein n=1 Tax=Portunus trituberculatus TaxID=210409 RepID=A0A5B7DZ81_PORTR|nr:hypothetical protein [Portunus trituberculatus]